MKTFDKYCKLLLQTKAMGEYEIKALCWALNGVKKVNLTAIERSTLRGLINHKDERPITKEQSTFGITWLRKTAFKLNGEARKNCIFGSFEQSVIKNFSHFKFAGLFDVNQNHYSNYRHFVPIWRTYAKDGRSFDYIVGGQGGQIEIININTTTKLKLVSNQ